MHCLIESPRCCYSHFTEAKVGSLERIGDVPASTPLDDGRSSSHIWVKWTSMPELKKQAQPPSWRALNVALRCLAAIEQTYQPPLACGCDPGLPGHTAQGVETTTAVASHICLCAAAPGAPLLLAHMQRSCCCRRWPRVPQWAMETMGKKACGHFSFYCPCTAARWP